MKNGFTVVALACSMFLAACSGAPDDGVGTSEGSLSVTEVKVPGYKQVDVKDNRFNAARSEVRDLAAAEYANTQINEVAARADRLVGAAQQADRALPEVPGRVEFDRSIQKVPAFNDVVHEVNAGESMGVSDVGNLVRPGDVVLEGAAAENGPKLDPNTPRPGDPTCMACR
jgi:hypothetical protein